MSSPSLRHPCNRRQALAGLGLLVSAGAARAEVADEVWLDASRRRELPLRIRWPAGGGGSAVILHSHGLGGSREGGDAWGEAWRAAGFVVVHLQHPGSDSAALRDGIGALRRAASPEQLLARVADTRFAIDDLRRRKATAGSPWSRVDVERVGIAGHSFGAHTTLALAGQRYAVEGPSLADVRARAFIAFSPSLGKGPLGPAQQFGAITRPMLLLTGSHDAQPFEPGSDGRSRARVYDGLPSGKRALLWLDGADHMSFAGNAERRIDGRGPFKREAVAAAREPRHHALLARVSTDWWRWHLLDDAQAAARLRPPAGLEGADRWAQD